MICVSLFVLEQAAEERERILDHYNIALENPVTILHQEQAKTFFCQKDAENSLWKFLMASTQMKSIQDEYRDSRTQLELAQAQLHEKRKHLEDAKQELKELSKKENSYKKFEITNKKQPVNEMIKWGWANDCKKKYETSSKECEEKTSELEKLNNDLEGWKASLEDLHRKKEQFEFKNNQVKDNAKLKYDEIEIIRENFRTLSERKLLAESTLKEINLGQGKKYLQL